MPGGPLVSVVIAVYNGERFVGEAIESVLRQTWTQLEVVIVDDGSTDGTPAVIEASAADPRVRSIRQENGGVSNARNAGIAAATGELVAFLDADDVWLPDKVEHQVALFREHPDLGLVYGSYIIVDVALQERTVIRPASGRAAVMRWLILEGNGIGLAFTGMVPRAVIESEGGFDEELSTSADLEFAVRVAAAHPVASVRSPVSLYRAHGGQMHLDMGAFERDMLLIFERQLSDPGSRRRRRRAEANLYTRIFFAELAARDWGPAGRALRVALARRPDRLVALPAGVAARRVERAVVRRLRRLTGRTVVPPLGSPAGGPG